MTWFTFIISLVAPIAKKVCLALGVGVITVAGFDLALDGLTTLINNNLGSVSADIFGLASMMGIPDAIGIMLGGLSSAATLVAVKRFNVL